MHIYIYDCFINQKKYDAITAKIETRITDLGLNGKIIRLSLMNSLDEIIRDEIKKGAKTIIVVGNNTIFNQAINAMAKTHHELSITKRVPLGFIPVGKDDNEIAPLLGINLEEAACNTISGRIIKKFDLGLANDYYFLTEAVISTDGTKIEIDQKYVIQIEKPGNIKIINFAVNTKLPPSISSCAQDDVLDLFIENKKAGGFFKKNEDKSSIIPFKFLTILNQKNPLFIDQDIKITPPVNIQIAKQKIEIIVGKGLNL